jgi:hypothetical protein
VAFSITHTTGAMESNPAPEAIPALLDELVGHQDPEHPDVALSHESGWTLSVFPSMRVIWENVEEDGEPGHLEALDRSTVEGLLAALAAGRIAEVGSAGWRPGY